MDKKLITIPALTVIICVAWFMLIHMPLQKSSSRFIQKIDVLEQREKAQISEEQLQTVQMLVDSLEKQIARNTEKFYPADHLLDLGREIEDIVETYDIRLVSITPNYPSLAIFKDSQSTVVELPLSVELQGRFMQFAEFLDNLQSLPFTFNVNEVTLEVRKESTKSIAIILKGVIVLDRERKELGHEVNT